MLKIKILIVKIFRKSFFFFFPELENIQLKNKFVFNCKISDFAKIYGNFDIRESAIGDYSYIASNSCIHSTTIGKFSSIGKNFNCGLGIHPTSGISTSPTFYSLNNSNGLTLSESEKIPQRKEVLIGNDVWIGINVTILDGVIIGDGAIIAAGSVVTKDVSDYAIVGGIPAKIIKYRFDEQSISDLKTIQWWNMPIEKLKEVESQFFNAAEFIKNNKD